MELLILKKSRKTESSAVFIDITLNHLKSLPIYSKKLTKMTKQAAITVMRNLSS